jgi:hypothetical protein
MPLESTATPVVGVVWKCPTCNQDVHTPFCAICGEHPAPERDLTLAGFLEHFVRGVTSVDGKLIRSFRCLVANPGVLTVSYLRGQRKLYNTPLQLFFLANVFFFAVHFNTEAKVFSAPLASHLHTQPWSPFAAGLVQRHLLRSHTTLELYTPIFNEAVSAHARSLITLMIVPFALMPLLLFRSRSRPFVAHVVFSLHFFSFTLILLCLATPLTSAYEFSYHVSEIPDHLDQVLSVLLLVILAVYLHIATRVVYAARGLQRAVIVLALTVAAAATVLGYRFALFLITLYTT